MKKERKDLKILLLSFRDKGRMFSEELEGFSRSSGLEPKQFQILSALEVVPKRSDLEGIDGIMIGGSKWSVFQEVPNIAETKELLKEAHQKKIPILGICFGHQLLTVTFGGQVVRDEENEEFGTYDIILNQEGQEDPLFKGIPIHFPAICGHHDCVSKLPDTFINLASNNRCAYHAFRIKDVPIYGVQFHPEHTAESFKRIMDTVGRQYFSNDQKVDGIIGRITEAKHAGTIPTRFIERIVLREG